MQTHEAFCKQKNKNLTQKLTVSHFSKISHKCVNPTNRQIIFKLLKNIKAAQKKIPYSLLQK